MTSDSMSGTTLYYPYIHPRSVGHLNAALLFWDRVRRIVPRSVDAGGWVYDDDRDARLLAENDLLVATAPQGYEEKAAQLFLSTIEPRLEEFRINKDRAGELALRKLGIHIEKLAYPLLGQLEALGVAHRIGSWVSMESTVSSLYMFCLATEMSRRMNAPLLADEDEEASIGQTLLFSESASRDTSELLVRLDLELPTPDEMSTVPVKEVVEFSLQRADERIRFRDVVEEILAKARKIEDANELEDYLDTERKSIAAAVGDYRRTIDELKVSAVTSAAKLSVPATAASTIALLDVSGVAASILAGLGITIAAVDVFAATRGRARAAAVKSPYHYLHSIHREFRGH